MKKLVLVALLLITCAKGFSQNKNEEVCYNPNLIKDSSKKSINSVAFAKVKGDSIKINYHSPGVRNRVIWGGLVPYDEVWVTGAHNATLLTVNTPITVGGKKLSAGKYAIFTIPGKEYWTFIINKNWEQHLTNEYEEKDDIVRLKISPQQNAHTERLQYFITSDGKQGSIAMAWEKLKITVPFVLSLN